MEPKKLKLTETKSTKVDGGQRGLREGRMLAPGWEVSARKREVL